MNIHVALGVLSAVVYAAAYVPYVISVARGKARPHPFSWLLWSILGFVSFFLYVRVGAKATLPLAFCNGLLPLVITVLSLKRWQGAFSRFDYVCLGISLAAIVTYLFTRNATAALSINILGDLTAFLPTLRKTRKDPLSEDLFTWVLFTVGYLLSILAISRWSYGIVILPLYLSLLGTSMCVVMLGARLKKNP